MANLKDNKDSTSPFKNMLQNFFGSIADSYYKEDKKDLTTEITTHKERTAFLDMLKSLFDTVRTVDDAAVTNDDKSSIFWVY